MTIRQKQFTPGKGALYFFSGTGNTSFVSQEFFSFYTARNISLDVFDILKLENVSSQAKYDFLIIGFPTYAFFPPKAVLDFVNNLPEVKDKPVIIFATAEKNAGASFFVLEKILLKKKYSVVSNLLYLLPSNCNFLFKIDAIEDTKIEQLVTNAKEKIKDDLNNILSAKAVYKKTNVFVVFFSYIANFFFKLFSSKKKWFWDKQECDFCGVCVDVCPTKNITLKKEKRKVSFGNNCLFCTRCYNFCPKKAIHYKSINNTKGLKRYTKMKNKIIK